ncbi:MAG: glycogen/starch synthase [Saprospiraceae bacterium]
MTKKRVLFISQEMKPYTTLSEISDMVQALAPYIYNKGYEVRVLMPKFGTINERRHRLHEVVRLSGMNIIVDDDDFPLIIKVASLPGSRMQVYFLDNEEFFKRKLVFDDADDKPFNDNAERMIFFCKGAMETVKKFGWPPDIIHCHGWMSSLVPVYFQKIYKNSPIFENAKMVYSPYDSSYEESFDKSFIEKACINSIEEEDLAGYIQNDKIKLNEGAIQHVDGIMPGKMALNESVLEAIAASPAPLQEYIEGEEYLTEVLNFYSSLLEE